MHGYHLRRLERLQDLDHPLEIEGVAAVDRYEHNVNPPDLVELLLGQSVVQVAEMGDAHVSELEDEY